MKECENCGRRFYPRSGVQKYCCRKCANAKNIKNLKEKVCEVCGNKFIPKQARQKYCGFECAERAKKEWERIKNAAKNKTPINCKFCGKEFIPNNGQEKYCSPECLKEYHREQAKIKYPPMKCLVCGEVFTPKRKDQVACENPECKKKAYRIQHQENVKSLALEEPPKRKKKKYTIKEWNALTPSERWELMTLNEVSAENVKYHIPTYGKSETLARWGRLPEDYGKRERKSKQ